MSPATVTTRTVGTGRRRFESSGQMGELIASKDWSGTVLGSPAHWPAALRGAVGIMLSSRFPMFVGWGPQLIMLYNDAYAPILGKKHPDTMGQPFERVWHELWTVIEPLTSAVLANEAIYQEDLLLVMQRSGFTEETYFTFSYSPIHSAEGPPAGLFCACTDTTARVMGERRLRTLRELGDTSAAQAPTVRHALLAAVEMLGGNRADVPYAMAYLLDDDGSAARLVGSYGRCQPGRRGRTRRRDGASRGPGGRGTRHAPTAPGATSRPRFSGCPATGPTSSSGEAPGARPPR